MSLNWFYKNDNILIDKFYSMDILLILEFFIILKVHFLFILIVFLLKLKILN